MAQKVGPVTEIAGLHPEDVKAVIRKRFGSISRFVKVRGLPATGVSDVFRGRPSRRVREAIEAVLEQENAINGSQPSSAAEKKAVSA